MLVLTTILSGELLHNTLQVNSLSAPVKTGTVCFSPELVRPLPKANPRSQQTKGRTKSKCAILTDTPEEEAMEREQLQKIKKTKNNVVNGGKRKTKPSKKKTNPAESSYDEE